MKREDIIRMAHEAGIPMEYKFIDGATHWIVHPTLERFAELVAAAQKQQKPFWQTGCTVCGSGKNGSTTGVVCYNPNCPIRITCTSVT